MHFLTPLMNPDSGVMRRRASYSRHEKKILPSRSASNLTAAKPCRTAYTERQKVPNGRGSRHRRRADRLSGARADLRDRRRCAHAAGRCAAPALSTIVEAIRQQGWVGLMTTQNAATGTIRHAAGGTGDDGARSEDPQRERRACFLAAHPTTPPPPGSKPEMPRAPKRGILQRWLTVSGRQGL